MLFSFVFLPCPLPCSYLVSKARFCSTHISCVYPFFSSHGKCLIISTSVIYFALQQHHILHSVLHASSKVIFSYQLIWCCQFSSKVYDGRPLPCLVLPFMAISQAGRSYTIHPPDVLSQHNTASVAVLTFGVG